MILQASLTCPICGMTTRAIMPTDACQRFFECPGCKTILRPRPGDCCVFCSYADVKCPPQQEEAWK
ncbi:GDCCVxC domain-containing (seleno)protein [Meiothermus granaticius]|uniref:GDCCVxC domain-containing (seleno)protein n=1 Tax=Meiothermus granaticius TaxID=863370 RepID=UPI000E657992|nr:GDCCVxC domain-containing (seleno)protein [Meiothermus granaticius]